jgi:hypothetical protein
MIREVIFGVTFSFIQLIDHCEDQSLLLFRSWTELSI